MSAPIQKSAAKIRAATQVVTANRLGDGVVVYLDPAGAWTETLGEAAILEGADQVAAAVETGKKAEADQIVIDPYPIDVARAEDGLRPLRLREVIRALGPTVRLDLNRQASA